MGLDDKTSLMEPEIVENIFFAGLGVSSFFLSTRKKWGNRKFVKHQVMCLSKSWVNELTLMHAFLLGFSACFLATETLFKRDQMRFRYGKRCETGELADDGMFVNYFRFHCFSKSHNWGFQWKPNRPKMPFDSQSNCVISFRTISLIFFLFALCHPLNLNNKRLHESINVESLISIIKPI